MHFWWKTETEDTDYLILTVQDKEVMRLSGETVFIEASYELPFNSGNGLKVQWTMIKDGDDLNCLSCANKAWIDQISFVAITSGI